MHISTQWIDEADRQRDRQTDRHRHMSTYACIHTNAHARKSTLNYVYLFVPHLYNMPSLISVTGATSHRHVINHYTDITGCCSAVNRKTEHGLTIFLFPVFCYF